MGILDEEDDFSKPSPSSPSIIVVAEAKDKDKDSRSEQNYRHQQNVNVNSSAAATVPLPPSPHLPQKIPPEAPHHPHHQRHPYPPRQYSFNASNFVWSTGLYSSLHEDLNLNEWKYFENCKRIWESAENRIKKHASKRSKGQRISGLGKIKQKGSHHRKSAGRNTKPSKKRDRATSPANFSLTAVAVEVPVPVPPLPSPYQFEEDLSMSLEPISSSSFHSSSDCDEDDERFS